MGTSNPESESGYSEQHDVWELTDEDIKAVHINADDNPVDRDYRYVTVIFCENQDHPSGVFVYAGSDMSGGLSHQAILQYARDPYFGYLRGRTVGEWGVLIDVINGNVVRESKGFQGNVDNRLLDIFIDSLREHHGFDDPENNLFEDY